MKILLVHQNLPGQYRHLAPALAAISGNEVVFLTQRRGISLPGVVTQVYRPHRGPGDKQHRYLQETEVGVLNGQAIAKVALALKRSGFIPDVMLGHNAWGETWYLKDVYPDTPLIGYFEFFYQVNGADVGFDPALPVGVDDGPRLRTKNLGNLLGLQAADWGQCPTEWQCSTYPAMYRSKLKVIHDGIDSDVAKPDANARLEVPGTNMAIQAGDEVVTYVARNLEPYRGFPSFMRSLPGILARRPKARVLIVGGDEVSYGHRLPDGKTFRAKLLDDLGDDIDSSRVHFLGRVPYATFLKVIQVSRVHVYLTYPFVLSWSMLEAMAAGCLVVGSRTAPVEEVIRDGDNGFLVDFFKPDDIAEKVIAALMDGNAFTPLRRRARETILERYDLRSVCLPDQLRWIGEVTSA